MSRYREICEQYNYTDKDFGPQPVYLTQRAAETALAAGVVQILPLKPEIALVAEFVNSKMTAPEYRFPEDIDEVAFVMRWAGKGNKVIWNWDTRLHKAEPRTCFMNAWDISPQNIAQLSVGGEPLESRRLRDLDPLNTIEISVEDWAKPDWARKIAVGALFNQARRRGKSFSEKLERDIFEAFDPESVRRFDVANAAAVIGRPFEDLLPLAPREKSDLAGR